MQRFSSGFLWVSLDSLAAVSLVADGMQAVDAVLRRRLYSEVPLVREVAEYIIHSGGKRLRPALLLLAAGSVGYQGSEQYDLAAVVELIHTATLLHDDVVDDSALRRGRETANARFGNPVSVLVGDFLYSRAFQMMVELRQPRVMQVLAEATNIIAEGEVLQLMNCHDAEIDEQRYLQVIRYKTAQLFAAAAQMGAIVAAAPTSVERALMNYGMHLGTAFQIVDDVLDYSGSEAETGKNLGDDLAEGKPTLPLIYLLQQGTPAEAALVRQAIQKGGRDTFAEVLNAVRSSRALNYAKEIALVESNLALAAIAEVPPSKHKESLLELAAFSVSRSS